jgi:hypothetical protein
LTTTLRKGGSIYTYSGRLFFPIDPHSEDVCIEDIAQSLSLKCRWTGQCSHFYSVAEHSIRVSNVAAALARLDKRSGDEIAKIIAHGLLHDAHEAYLADLASPIKSLVPGWREIEDKIQVAILDYFGLDHSHGAPYVKRADSMLLWIEHLELFEKTLTMEDVFFGKGGPNLWPTYPEIPTEALNAAKLPYDNSRDRLIASFQALKFYYGKVRS